MSDFDETVSDFDKTVYSGRGASGVSGSPPPAAPSPVPPKKRNPLLIIAGVGCALLLCLALLGVAGFFLMRSDQLPDIVAGLGDATATPTLVAETPTQAAETPSITSTEAATNEATVEAGTVTGSETSEPQSPVEETPTAA
jgi:hypothetical protein